MRLDDYAGREDFDLPTLSLPSGADQHERAKRRGAGAEQRKLAWQFAGWTAFAVGAGGSPESRVGRANGSDAKLQAAFTRERTGGAPLAARKERFYLSDLQAA